MTQADEREPTELDSVDDGPKYEHEINTVLMSGGAPNSPLMAGFLYALLEKGKMFSNYHTAGAGTLMALLCLAPRVNESRDKDDEPGCGDNGEHGGEHDDPPALEAQKLSPENARKDGMRALKEWVDAGVSDDIYDFFPVNFKLFQKPGPFAPLMSRLAGRYHVGVQDGRLDPTTSDPFRGLRSTFVSRIFDTPERRRTYNDLVDLMFSAMTPSTLTPRSKGLAAPLPFLEDKVDFEKLQKKVPVHLCVNAFNMASGEMEIFHRKVIDAKHIRAAFSMPFIYPPAQIDSDYYSEGADHEPINFKPLYDEREEAWKKKFGDEFIKEKEANEEARKVKQKEIEKVDKDLDQLREKLKSTTSDTPEDEAKLDEKMEEAVNAKGRHELELNGLVKALGQINDKIDRQRKDRPIQRVVLLDVMGSLDELLVRPPRGLWDAYVISIMTPVVALAKKQLQLFDAKQELFIEQHGYQYFELLKVSFNIPSYAQPYVMDWSRSNLDTLFNAGYEEGVKFLDKYEESLPTITEVYARDPGHVH